MNPQSGNRHANSQWDQLEPRIDELVGDYAVFNTEGPGHATELTRDALREGYTRVVSTGGDGTHYEVVNGFFVDDAPVNPDASMAILPIGTACDLRKTLRLPKPTDSIDYLTNPDPIPMDVGKVISTDPDGNAVTNYFLTSVHIGLGGLVCLHVNRRSKRLGGFMTFLLGVITARLEYRCTEMTVSFDGQTVTGSMLEILVANGQYDGGGMTVAPHCELNNGQLELYTIARMNIPDTIRNLPRIYKGTQDEHPDVGYFRTPEVEITTAAETPIWVSPDGEISGILPAKISILPQALKMVMGQNPPLKQ
jgi:diacylglycerol kinase (ATP)